MTSERRAQKFHTDDASLPTKIRVVLASDWLKQVSLMARPMRSITLFTQVCQVTRYQYGTSALVSETSFRGETVFSVPKSQLFSQANMFTK